MSYTTYLVLIALQCLGLPFALLVSPPEKVIRPDGSKLELPQKDKPIKGELKKMWNLLKKKQMLFLIPVLVGFNWNGTYLGIYQTN